MRISDWSLDVCSSDLRDRQPVESGPQLLDLRLERRLLPSRFRPVLKPQRGACARRGAAAVQGEQATAVGQARIEVEGCPRALPCLQRRLETATGGAGAGEIGRASRRERAGQYV